MSHYFFDTSALVKRHVTEPGTRWVRSLTRVPAGHFIYLAEITTVEMVAAITRRQRGGSLTAAQAGAILGHFRRQCRDYYSMLDVTSAILAQAAILCRVHNLRAYDAVQLAVIKRADQKRDQSGLGRIILVSADRELNAAASSEGLLVDDPNTHP